MEIQSTTLVSLHPSGFSQSYPRRRSKRQQTIASHCLQQALVSLPHLGPLESLQLSLPKNDCFPTATCSNLRITVISLMHISDDLCAPALRPCPGQDPRFHFFLGVQVCSRTTVSAYDVRMRRMKHNLEGDTSKIRQDAGNWPCIKGEKNKRKGGGSDKVGLKKPLSSHRG